MPKLIPPMRVTDGGLPCERLTGGGRLTELVLVVVTDLTSQLIDDPGTHRRHHPRGDPVDVDEIIAEACAAPVRRRCGVDPGRRIPAQAIVGGAQCMTARHVPVDPGRVDGLVASAWDFARQVVEKRQWHRLDDQTPQSFVERGQQIDVAGILRRSRPMATSCGRCRPTLNTAEPSG